MPKAMPNSVGALVLPKEIESLKGYQEYLVCSPASRYDRSTHGDRLRDRTALAPGCFGRVSVAFEAVLQGDHIGVDVGTCAHASFLIQSGQPLLDSQLCEGLMIDDYFVLSKQPHSVPLQDTDAAKMLEKARECYASQGMLGSSEKDDLSAKAKVIGALVNSSVDATSRGLVTVGARPYQPSP